MQAEECLLHDVLGCLPAAQHDVGKPDEAEGVVRVQCADGGGPFGRA